MMRDLPTTIRVDFTGVRLVTKPEEIQVGERNNSLVLRLQEPDALRCASEDELRAIAKAWNERLPEPMSRQEVRDVVRKKWRWFQTQDGVVLRWKQHVRDRGPTSTRVSGVWSAVTDVSHEFESYTVHGVLPPTGCVAFFGPAGSAKSTIEVALASSIALGRPWHGRDIDLPSPVAIVAAEAPGSLKRRFRAWARDNSIPYDSLGFQVSIWQGALDLNSPESVAAFTASIPQLVDVACVVPRVWFLDTLPAAMTGDENSTQLQSAVQALYQAIRRARNADPLLVVLHHTGKDETREERGHSSLRALVDTSIRIETGESTGAQPTKEQPSVLVKRGVATIRKQRDGVDGQAFPFEIHAVYVGTDEKGRPRSQVVHRPSKDLAAAHAAIAAKRSRSTTVGAAIEAGFTTLSGTSAECAYQALLAHVAEACGKESADLVKNFNRALDRAGFDSVRRGQHRVVRRRGQS